MLKTIHKFFKFAGKQSTNLKRSMALSFLYSIFQAFQIGAVYIVLKAIVEQNVTYITAILSFGIMFISVVGTIIIGHRSRMGEIEASFNMCVDKRMEVGNRMRYMPMGYFNSTSLGEITATMTNTMEDMQDIAPRVMDKTVHGAINAAVLTLAMFIFDWRIGLVVVAGIGAFLFVNSLMQQMSHKITGKRIAAQSALVGAVLEYVLGMGVVRTFNLVGDANKRIDRAIVECEKQNVTLEMSFIPFIFAQSLILRLASILIAVTTIALFFSGNMELAKCVLMIVSSFIIYAQLESAGSMSALLRAVDSSIDRVDAINDAPIMNKEGVAKLSHDLTIRAENVSFSYDKAKVINNVNFTIHQGSTTAIVGPSGGGKSTLCSLIARFWDVDEGKITIGETDVREYGLDALMELFSVVFQNVYLFGDTIANNIKFGKQNATREEVILAAKKANCHEFILEMPDGYDTLIGEGGATLSGGERQRISIARAILKDAPIVILDEATANVDPENEKFLQNAILELTKDKTIIMIAHRLKTVRNADQILVVDAGKITQRGTHETLMREGGLYAEFVGMRERTIGWKLSRT